MIARILGHAGDGTGSHLLRVGAAGAQQCDKRRDASLLDDCGTEIRLILGNARQDSGGEHLAIRCAILQQRHSRCDDIHLDDHLGVFLALRRVRLQQPLQRLRGLFLLVQIAGS